MEQPLVDGEGYPRSDIDVYSVRHARHQIICKRSITYLLRGLSQELSTVDFWLYHTSGRPIYSTLCTFEIHSYHFARTSFQDNTMWSNLIILNCVVHYFRRQIDRNYAYIYEELEGLPFFPFKYGSQCSESSFTFIHFRPLFG